MEPTQDVRADGDAVTLIAGRYELHECLGTGGMSEVRAGVDQRLRRPVAVKRLKPEMAARDDVRARFETEARWAARLSHPNAVAVYDTGEDAGVPFLVMERLPGETLADRIAEGSLDPDWVRTTAIDLLGALQAAHDQGIVHRDIKPGNILLTLEGQPKLADFGIAKSTGLDTDGDRRDLTHTGQLIGTPSYLAPERLDGDPATPQSDVYALGVVLYEALSGRKPFTGATPLAVAFAIKHDDPTPLAQLRPDADPVLVAAVDRAMARNPAERFASAADMAAALTGGPPPTSVVTGMGETAFLERPSFDAAATAVVDQPVVAPPSPAGAPVRRRRRGRIGAAPVVLLVLGLLVLAAVAIAASRNGSSGGNGNGAAGQTAGGSVQHADVVNALNDAATRLATGDGPRGAEAAQRLREIATTVGSGGDASGAATALLKDVRTWRASRELGTTAASVAENALTKVPGVDASVAAAAVSVPATAARVDANVKAGPGKAKGHKGRGGEGD